MKRTWNYRIMATPVNGEPEPYFQIMEVHYTDDVPTGYSSLGARFGGDTVEEIAMMLDLAKSAIEKPVLWYGDRFPKEYKKQTT